MTRSAAVRVVEISGGRIRARQDRLAVEEPLEIRLETPAGPVPLAVTMRTPGDDLELAAGFLFGEGIVRCAEDIVTLRHCRQVPADRRDNTVTARLLSGPATAAAGLARRFTVTSACGVCGLESLDDLAARGVRPVQETPVDPDALLTLPARLRESQRTFDRTGGLHAAGLFAPSGELLCAREDVGRHNALDKVIGWALLRGSLPLDRHTLMVSGRTSYELAQKSVASGAGILAGVSAPSTLAVELARGFRLALAGFVRDDRFLLYTGRLGNTDSTGNESVPLRKP